MNTFSDFNMLPSLAQTLVKQRLFKPTEIQTKIIPAMMEKKSVVGISETGSGKTLAYALPLLHMLKNLEAQDNPITEHSSPRAIVMVPTRELGEQVSKVFKTLTHDTRLRVRPALGGMALEQARRNVANPFEILLATPGRLVQLMDMGLIHLTDVRMLIFDEADQMLDQGFLPDSNFIVAACPSVLQMGLFSATVSPSVQELMNTLFRSAEVVRSSGSGKVVKTLVTKNIIVQDGKRWPLFEKILGQRVKGGTLVFTNTREQCDKLAKEITDKGFLCAIYRGDMDKNERRQNFKKFRDGKIDLLVATDLAGRGLDLEAVSRVINYHLPQQLENYLHRVGRTARAGRSGEVVNLVTERDSRLMAELDGKKPAPYKKEEPRQEKKTADKFKGRTKEKTKGSSEAKPLFEKKAKPAATAKINKLPGRGTLRQPVLKKKTFGKR